MLTPPNSLRHHTEGKLAAATEEVNLNSMGVTIPGK